LIGSRENDLTRSTIEQRVKDRFVPSGAGVGPISVTDWKILDYSSCFSVDWTVQGSRAGVFVKIPKVDIDRRTVGPRTEEDRLLGRHEFSSLSYLNQHWIGSADVRYVEPLAFYPDVNAIVTRRAYATDLLPRFRVADTQRKCSRSQREDATALALKGIGIALREFHDRARLAEHFGVGTFNAAEVVERATRISGHLRDYGVPQKYLRTILCQLSVWRGYSRPATDTLTLKGLDIRNVLVGEKQRVYLLDPGRLKRDREEADLARLLVTSRILYWGTPLFWLKVTPSAIYEHSLLNGYGRDTRDDGIVLRLYVVKELFKHWRAAYVALLRKRWPWIVESAMRRTYIDAFYVSALSHELAQLSGTSPCAA
jgi:hypothetical protein